jgi:hypothetical protein
VIVALRPQVHRKKPDALHLGVTDVVRLAAQSVGLSVGCIRTDTCSLVVAEILRIR